MMTAAFSGLQLYQQKSNITELQNRNKHEKKKQQILKSAVVEKAGILTEKEAAVESLLAQTESQEPGITEQSVVSSIPALDARFSAVTDRVNQQTREVELAAVAASEEKARLRRTAQRAEVIFLIVSLGAAAATAVLVLVSG